MQEIKTINRTESVKRGLTSIQANFEEPAFVPVLARLLAKGQPVGIERLADAGGWSREHIRAVLAKYPSVEWDESGRIIGFGLTLHPTPHKFTFEGTTVYGWCASDALIFPVLLGKQGVIESKCAVTNQSIHVEATPQAVLRVDPPHAVVSEVRPAERVADVRADICALGHFFSSREVAADWLMRYPEGQLNSVADDFEIHRRIMEELGWAAG